MSSRVSPQPTGVPILITGKNSPPLFPHWQGQQQGQTRQVVRCTSQHNPVEVGSEQVLYLAPLLRGHAICTQM